MHSTILLQMVAVCVSFMSILGCRRPSEGVNSIELSVQQPSELVEDSKNGPYILSPRMEANEENGICIIESSSKSLTNHADAFGTLQVNTFSGFDRDGAGEQKLRDLRCILSINFFGESPYKWVIGPDDIVITNSKDQTEIRIANPRSGNALKL